MSDPLTRQCIKLETELASAQADHGPESPEVASALERYAEFLRTKKIRLLDAANMEARARVIRREMTSTAPTVGTGARQHIERDVRCPKCASEMQLGKAVVQGTPLSWLDPTLNSSTANGGKPIFASRCIKCGYLEFHAQ
jgi:hypothetical protein